MALLDLSAATGSHAPSRWARRLVGVLRDAAALALLLLVALSPLLLRLWLLMR